MSARARIHDTLDRLERWLREHQPAFLDAMRPGATDAELDDLERAIGRTLPDDVRAFYRWRNGIDSYCPFDAEGQYVGPGNPFWSHFRPMPLHEIGAEHAEFCAYAEADWKDAARPTWWHPAWVPFLSLDECQLWYCVDTVGVWTGTRGQIVCFDNKGEDRTIEAASLGDWLQIRVEDLERGLIFLPNGQPNADADDRHPFGYPDYRFKATLRPAIPMVLSAPTDLPKFGIGSRVEVRESHSLAGQMGTVVRFGPGSEVTVNFVLWGRSIELPVPVEAVSVIENAGNDQDAATAHANEWSISTDAQRLFDLLGPSVSVRKLWLFAAASWRDGEGLPPLPVIGHIEQVADGSMPLAELAQSLDAFWSTISDYSTRQRVGWSTQWLRRAVYEGVQNVETLGATFRHGSDAIDLVRDVFPNPFAPPRFDPAWRTPDVTALARGIYDARAFDGLPVLADALQEAGCDNDELLNHLRDMSRTHIRGCWALDLCLGLE